MELLNARRQSQISRSLAASAEKFDSDLEFNCNQQLPRYVNEFYDTKLSPFSLSLSLLFSPLLSTRDRSPTRNVVKRIRFRYLPTIVAIFLSLLHAYGSFFFPLLSLFPFWTRQPRSARIERIYWFSGESGIKDWHLYCREYVKRVFSWRDTERRLRPVLDDTLLFSFFIRRYAFLFIFSRTYVSSINTGTRSSRKNMGIVAIPNRSCSLRVRLCADLFPKFSREANTASVYIFLRTKANISFVYFIYFRDL